MGWLGRLFGGRERQALDIETVIAAYGKVLDKPGAVQRDVSELPYDKSVIDRALIVAIQNFPEGVMREQLRAGYMMLANYQVLSEDEKLAIKEFDTISRLGADEDIDAVAAKMAAIGGTSAVNQRIEMEASQRLAEVSLAGKNE